VRVKAPKNDEPRIVTLPAYVVAALRSHRLNQAEALLRLGVRATAETPICTRDDGSRWEPEALTMAFRRAIGKLNGVPTLTFHGLRHCHASLLAEAGVAPKTVQARLGHSDAQMTMGVYVHSSDAAEKMDALFRRFGARN
jgi:integrase